LKSHLGARFLADFRATVGRIATMGGAWRKVHGEFRHLKFNDFPYFAYFRADGGQFYVPLEIDAARSPAMVSRLLSERS